MYIAILYSENELYTTDLFSSFAAIVGAVMCMSAKAKH